MLLVIKKVCEYGILICGLAGGLFTVGLNSAKLIEKDAEGSNKDISEEETENTKSEEVEA